MKTAIAVITYRRLHALKVTLEGLLPWGYPMAVFEDNGATDGTSAYLGQGPRTDRDDLLAYQHDHPSGYKAFLGKLNLGVAGNSNRAIKWFMEETDAEHLCLLNDDLHVLGDFPRFYKQAHKDLGVGFFCFNDFTDERHRWIIARSRGYRIKVFPMMTGIMISALRSAVAKVGYFDIRFGKFGEEHCDYTNRMRFAGQIQLDGLDQPCLDVEPTLPDGKAGPPVLKHQEVETSLAGVERQRADEEAAQAIREAASRYQFEHFYRPFGLLNPKYAGGFGQQGIRVDSMPGYKVVTTCS